jgi:hypothetical protein
MKAEKIYYFSHKQEQKTHKSTIQDDIEEESSRPANQQVDMSFACQINAEIETTAPEELTSLIRTLYTREYQYYYIAEQTSQKRILSTKDIKYVLDSLFKRVEFLDQVNALGHNTSGAFIMGVFSQSPYSRSHEFPEIHRAWGLQALSYAMENAQFKKIIDVLGKESFTEPAKQNISFLQNEFFSLLQEKDPVLKRTAAIAITYLLLSNTHNTANYNLTPVFTTLKEMLSQPPLLKHDNIDNMFSLEKERNSLGVRMRAAKALFRLIARNYTIPDAIVPIALNYLYSVEEKTIFYFGPCVDQNKQCANEISSAYTLLYTYEGSALENYLFSRNQLYNIYWNILKTADQSCLRALFYAITINGQILPIKFDGTWLWRSITLSDVIEKCVEIIEPSNIYKLEQKLAAACVLSVLPTISKENFLIGIRYVIQRTPASEYSDSLIYTQCNIALAYAFKRHRVWMSDFSILINSQFDPIRVTILKFLAHYIERNHQKLVAFDDLEGRLQKLQLNTNVEVSIAALECLNLLSAKNQRTYDYDQNFKASLLAGITNPQKQSHIIDTIAIMVKNQKRGHANNIETALFDAMCRVFLESHNEDLHSKIIYIIAKLIENSLRLEVPFPAPTFVPLLIVRVIEITKKEPANSHPSTLLKLISENILHHRKFLDCINMFIHYLNDIYQILLSAEHQALIKQNLLEFLWNFISYEINNNLTVRIDFPRLIQTLTQIIKERQFTAISIKILNLLISHNVVFPKELFEELILQLKEKDPIIPRNIQVLFRNYIRDHHTEKLPAQTIAQLGKHLTNQKVFMYVRPILYYLIIDQKYTTPIQPDAILTFLDAAQCEQEEISTFSSSLLFHCLPSLTIDLLREIKLSLDDIYQKGMIKTSITLLNTLFHFLINNTIDNTFIDRPLVDMIAQLMSQSAFSLEERKVIYQGLSKYSIQANINLLEHPINDMRMSDSVAMDSISLLASMLNNSTDIQANNEDIEKKIIRCFEQHIHRQLLTKPILKNILEILTKKNHLANIFSPSFIELCISFQYEAQNESDNKQSAFGILSILTKSNASLDVELIINIRNICLLEEEAEQLLAACHYHEIYITQLNQQATQGNRITLSALQYLTRCHEFAKGNINYVLLIDTFIKIAKNGQPILPRIHGLLKNLLKNNQYVDEIIDIVNHNMNHGCLLDDALFVLIQEKLNMQDVGISRANKIIGILKKQAIRGKSIVPHVVNSLMSFMKSSSSNEKKSHAAFILSLQSEKNQELLSYSHDKEIKKELLNILITNQTDLDTHYSTLLKKLFPHVWDKASLYLSFKEKSILFLGGSSNKKNLLQEIYQILSKINQSKFIARQEVQQDMIEIINKVVSRNLSMITQLDDNTLHILIQCIRIFPNYIPPQSIIEELYMSVLNTPESLDLLLTLLSKLVEHPEVNQIRSTLILLLKSIIKQTSDEALEKSAFVLFKQVYLPTQKNTSIPLNDEFLMAYIKKDHEYEELKLNDLLYKPNIHKGVKYAISILSKGKKLSASIIDRLNSLITDNKIETKTLLELYYTALNTLEPPSLVSLGESQLDKMISYFESHPQDISFSIEFLRVIKKHTLSIVQKNRLKLHEQKNTNIFVQAYIDTFNSSVSRFNDKKNYILSQNFFENKIKNYTKPPIAYSQFLFFYTALLEYFNKELSIETYFIHFFNYFFEEKLFFPIIGRLSILIMHCVEIYKLNATELITLLRYIQTSKECCFSQLNRFASSKQAFFYEVKLQWLNYQLFNASHKRISLEQEYYNKNIHFIVSKSEEYLIDLTSLQTCFLKDFSQNDFFDLVKLFQLFDNADEIGELQWKIRSLINDFSQNTQYHSNITQLLKSCEAFFIAYQLKQEDSNKPDNNFSYLIDVLISLLYQGWSRESLMRIGKNLKSENLVIFFEKMLRYKIGPEHSESLANITVNNAGNPLETLHDFFLNLHFPKDQAIERSLPELIDKFSFKNKINDKTTLNALRSFIEIVADDGNKNKVFKNISPLPLEKWTEKEFKLWTSMIDEKTSLEEMLIVINQAIKLCTSREPRFKDNNLPGFGLREAQFLAIKYLIEERGNILGQLPTGEGKSFVIFVVATLKILKGRAALKKSPEKKKPTIDIVVSSPIFAERETSNFISLFNLFDISCAHNNSHTFHENTSKPYPCYDADIVYGEISQFQFHYLMTVFKQQGGRGDRVFDLVIIDEADSVMLDQATNVTKLAENLPGLDQLEFIYILIWSHLGRLLNGYDILLSPPPKDALSKDTLYLYKNDNGVLVYSLKHANDEEIHDAIFNSIVGFTKEKKDIINELNNRITMGDDTISLKFQNDIILKNTIFQLILNKENYEEAKTFESFDELPQLKKRLKKYIEGILNTTLTLKDNTTQKILLPKHLDDLIKFQLDIWINNAIDVFFAMKEDEIFVVGKRENDGTSYIAPVDASDTGTTLTNTQWSDGVHEFLQLKKGLRLSPETLTTNYLSNYTFLCGYGQIIGVTGTNGNENTQILFSKMYKNKKTQTLLKCVIFPSHTRKRIFFYQPTITNNTTTWLEKTKKSVHQEVSLGRAVIIICKTIDDLNVLKDYLQTTNQHDELKYKISFFRRSDEDIFDADNSVFGPQDVFLTTNLGGRGIDPKPSLSVINKGGIHVIIASSSKNKRSFMQAAGRTSRKGDPGTVEIIINTENLNISGNPTLQELEDYRDNLENESFKELLDKDLPALELNDTLFLSFCAFLAEIKIKWNGKEPATYLEIAGNKITAFLKGWMDTSNQYMASLQKETKLSAIIERWGLWLKQLNRNLSESEIMTQFQTFTDEISSDEEDDTLVRNPCYLLQENNRILEYLNSLQHTLLGAGFYLDKFHQTIIENCDRITDPLFMCQANAIRAYALLTQEKPGANQQASHYFNAAIKNIEEYNLPQLLLQQIWLNSLDPHKKNPSSYSPCDFSNQITDKISTLSVFALRYETAVKQIEQARKLIDFCVDKDIKKSKSKLTQTECLNELKAYSSSTNIMLRFHDLRMVYDIGKEIRNEPLKLVDILFEKNFIKHKFKAYILFEICDEALHARINKARSTNPKLSNLEITIEKNEPINSTPDNNSHKSLKIPITNQVTISEFIRVFYLEISDAIIIVKSLSYNQAVHLLSELVLVEESFQRSSLRHVSSVFCNPKQRQDLHQLMANGFEYFFELKERQPLQVYTMGVIGLIAATEITLGALLLVFASPTVFGVGVAIGFIAEGITEAFDLIKIGVTREHNWVHYGIQKAFSLALIFGTAGISSALAVSSAKAKSAANVTSKTSANMAMSKGTDLSDDLLTKTTSILFQTKKTAAQKSAILLHNEAIKATIKTTVNCIMEATVDSLGAVVTPHVYAAFEKKVADLTENAISSAMQNRSYSLKMRQIFACAHLMQMTQFEFRFKRELMSIIKEDCQKHFSPLILGKIRGVQLLQESFMIQIIESCVNRALEHMCIEQSKLLNIEQLIEYFFREKHLEPQAVREHTQAIINLFADQRLIEKGLFNLIEQASFKSITINWNQYPNYSAYKEELTNLYHHLYHFVYGQLHHTLASIAQLDTQKITDIMYEVITSTILIEVVKAINLIESGVKGALKSLPGLAFAPSTLYDPKSFGSKETFQNTLAVLDPRRFSGLSHAVSSYLSKFISPSQLASTNDDKEEWVQHVNAFRISVSRMQHIDQQGGRKHFSVTEQFFYTATPEQEAVMTRELGLSLAEKDRKLKKSIHTLIVNKGLEQLFDWLAMNNTEIQALINHHELNRFLSILNLNVVVLSRLVVIGVNFWSDLYKIYDYLFGKENDLSHIILELREIALYKPLSQLFFQRANQIPQLITELKRKCQLFPFNQFITPQLDMLFSLPDELTIEFLTIIKHIILSDAASSLVKNLLDHKKQTEVSALYPLLDLLSANIANNEPSLVSSLLAFLNKHLITLYDLMMANTNDFNALFEAMGLHTEEEKIQLLQIGLSLFDTSAFPELYKNLKQLIPLYGNDTTALGLLMTFRFLYENKSFHEYLKKPSNQLLLERIVVSQTWLSLYPISSVLNTIVYDNLLYDLNLLAIAYIKHKENIFSIDCVYDTAGPTLRVLNQLTNQWAGCIIFGLLGLKQLCNEPLFMTSFKVMAAIAFYGTLTNILHKVVHNAKAPIDSIYSPIPKKKEMNANTTPSARNSALFGNNRHISLPPRRHAEEPIVVAERLVKCNTSIIS